VSLPRFSIAINTLNRAESLARTLDSFRYLDYPQFEVLVVNGPSTDDTERVLQQYAGVIKAGRCAVANLSVSRNVAIAMASGDVVAFIDDDAIPVPEWIDRLARGYDSPEIGGVGSFVFDYTGYTYQSRYILCDRFGGARMESRVNPTWLHSFPQSEEYPAHLGTNTSFRRDVLVSIGGFDEEYDYFLDETDVCVRMIDSGYVVRFIDDAFVYHKFLPSHLRGENRRVRNWYPMLKNKTYFSVKNGGQRAVREILAKVDEYAAVARSDIDEQVRAGVLPQTALAEFDVTAATAVRDGLQRGLAPARRLLGPDALARAAAPFKPFAKTFRDRTERLTICYLTQDYPPAHNGGVARFTHDLAIGLATRGHLVHVITRSAGLHDTVDFEDGVWVHRLLHREIQPPEVDARLGNWRRVNDWARVAHGEVRRIHRDLHPVDVIEAPIWDVEGLHCVNDPELGPRTVISLESTLSHVSAEQKWPITPDLQAQLDAERAVLEKAAAYHAISRAIVESIRERYSVSLPESRIGLAPLGLRDRSVATPAGAARDGNWTLLFVGRLERRKGIDVLLGIAPALLRSRRQLRLVIVGDDTISDDRGMPFKTRFLAEHAGDPLLRQVEFRGKVSDEELFAQYRDCDVFVAPSRYESFGLIFVEAMMFGKPVVGCRAGGMKEVIEDGETGLLAEPGDAASLLAALERLADDEPLRQRMGRAARAAYEARFTVDRMVDSALALYRRVKAANRQSC
jgi:glycosyltransferase involved in cell wall biosynthesis